MPEDKPKRHLRLRLEGGKFENLRFEPQPPKHGGAAQMTPPVRPTKQEVKVGDVEGQ